MTLNATLKPRRHKLPVAPQPLLENCPPASPAAHRAMSSPVLPTPLAPLLCPPTAHSFCPEESWQSYSEANKDTNGSSRQFCTCISMHYPFFSSLSFAATHKRLSSSRHCAFMTGFAAAPSHQPSATLARLPRFRRSRGQ